MSCAVPSCNNYFRKTKKTKPHVKYFRFPKDENIAALWKKACGNLDQNVKHGKLSLNQIYVHTF